MPPELQIEFLYFEDCPSHEEALQRLRTVLAESGLPATAIDIIRVETLEEAQSQRFPGSPTIRFNGVDIDPLAPSEPPGLACRAYHHEDGRITALPPVSLIRRALAAALAAHTIDPSGGSTP